MLLYLVLIVLYRPYKSCFSNLSIILNECLALIAVCLALANKFFTIGLDTEAFILFILQGLIILCLIFSLIRVFLHVRSLCRKEGEGKEGEKGEEGEEGRGERREAPRKKRELTDVDLSLNRAIKEEKKKINPYTAVLPQHSPLKSRGSRNPRSTRRQELDRIE